MADDDFSWSFDNTDIKGNSETDEREPSGSQLSDSGSWSSWESSRPVAQAGGVAADVSTDGPRNSPADGNITFNETLNDLTKIRNRIPKAATVKTDHAAKPSEAVAPLYEEKTSGFTWGNPGELPVENGYAGSPQPSPAAPGGRSSDGGRAKWILAHPLRLVGAIVALVYVATELVMCWQAAYEIMFPKKSAYQVWAEEHGTLQQLNQEVQDDYERWRENQPDIETLMRQDLGLEEVEDPDDYIYGDTAPQDTD